MAIIPTQLARVSNMLRASVAQSTIAHVQQSLLTVQNQLSTGRRLNLPSDNAGDSAIAQQIRKLLEQRQAYATNLTRAGMYLGEVDATMSSMTDLLEQAQNIASANVGSDVTADQRRSAAAIVDSIYNQLLMTANHQFDRVYVFGGDRSTEPPFVETAGGVQFVGTSNVLANAFDESTITPFMVNGQELFGAMSSRVQGTADLSPTISTTTRIVDLRGATGEGVQLGSIRIGNGVDSAVVDLSGADSIGDVINAINIAGVGQIAASIAPDGVSLVLSGGPADDITVSEVGGGATAAHLGILRAVGAGAGVELNGDDVKARVTLLTPLAGLRGGAGIDQTAGLVITNGLVTRTIDLSSAVTVEDMLNAINSSGAAVRAEINSNGTGINIYNPTQGTNMTVAENGGTTATDLGVRSFHAGTPLTELNFGRGVRTTQGSDFRLTDSAGVGFEVDLTGCRTIQDVISAINTLASGAGAGVVASFAATGNGIVLTDTAAGAGALRLVPLNFSSAAADLGLTGPAVAGVITGSDVNPVEPDGIFTHVAGLRDALLRSDAAAITRAAEGLKEDYDRVARIRGETGARLQDVESRQQRLEDQNIAARALLSSLEDVDYNDAVSRFQLLQTALQASLQTSARMLDLSLLDFLR